MIKKIQLKGLFLSGVTKRVDGVLKDDLNKVIMEWKLEKDGLVLNGSNWVVIGLSGLDGSNFNYSKNGGVLNGVRRTVMKDFTIQMYRYGYDSHEYLELPCDNSIRYSLEITTDDGFYVIDDVYPKKVDRTNERYLTLTFIIGKIMKKYGGFVTRTPLRSSTDWQELHVNIGFYSASHSAHKETIYRTKEEVCRDHNPPYPPELVYFDSTNNKYKSHYSAFSRSEVSLEYLFSEKSYLRNNRNNVTIYGDYYFVPINADLTQSIDIGYTTIYDSTAYMPFNYIKSGWASATSGYTFNEESTISFLNHDAIRPENLETLDPSKVQMVLQKNTHNYAYADTTERAYSNHSSNVTSVFYNVEDMTRYSAPIRHDCSGFIYVLNPNTTETEIPYTYSVWDEVESVV